MRPCCIIKKAKVWTNNDFLLGAFSVLEIVLLSCVWTNTSSMEFRNVELAISPRFFLACMNTPHVAPTTRLILGLWTFPFDDWKGILGIYLRLYQRDLRDLTPEFWWPYTSYFLPGYALKVNNVTHGRVSLHHKTNINWMYDIWSSKQNIYHHMFSVPTNNIELRNVTVRSNWRTWTIQTDAKTMFSTPLSRTVIHVNYFLEM